jgi:hypothetical protein
VEELARLHLHTEVQEEAFLDRLDLRRPFHHRGNTAQASRPATLLIMAKPFKTRNGPSFEREGERYPRRKAALRGC